MRIAIITPHSTGPIRGNITTVRRIIHHLVSSGIEILELPLDVMSPVEILTKLRHFAPDIIHAFHAHHSGPTACSIASKVSKPFIITMTGSDIHEREFREHPATVKALAQAAAVICFDKKSAAHVASYFPETADKLAIIPQGVATLPLADCSFPNIPDDAFVLLLPAALRPVKQVEFAITASAPLVSAINRLLLVIAGGAIDTAYTEHINQLLPDFPHAIWLGEIPYEKMGCLYKRADIVLNCSSYEEMPNSLLEAMSLGRPVLAADICGNSSLVTHGSTGWLFRGEDDFRDKLLNLAQDPVKRLETGKQAGQFALTSYSPELEAKHHVRLYKAILKSGALSAS